MSIRWFAESLTRFPCATNTTFQRKDLYQMVLHRPVELAPVAGMWLFTLPPETGDVNWFPSSTGNCSSGFSPPGDETREGSHEPQDRSTGAE
jgi:hypothetical protein